ncbi:unnamed protein product [Prunus armeniaca]|uniref:Uncharacterized protein n=1 Tax=Prunus armeniaca TaxID=36596 RepID=A0A6J5VSL9_PRUAR|nr:unnamed protein product [Prunus armeniaca]
MDLGCLDLGCISVSDKQGTNDAVLDSHNKENDATTTASPKIGKNKNLKETSLSTLNSLNKSQIKKPSHRRTSPLNWFPRKKGDSYLKRKIKMLQEVDGMNLTLDETLGDSNPHYSKVLREKMAAKEAAQKAMEARKAALVEASWCRILRASRIQSKEAEAQLLKADKAAAEAFEEATAVGVIMFDKPNCPRKPCKIETSTVNGGESTTHTVTASFETAFDVDKEVAAAVKIALVRLGNSPSFSKDEFKDLLRKISENPDTSENNQESSEFTSECESESGSELEVVSQKDTIISQDLDHKIPGFEERQSKNRRQSFGKLNMAKIADMMLERLQCLQEDELSSLATIVATCGLNAALAEVENSKLHDQGSAAETLPHRFGAAKPEYFRDGQVRRKQTISELPSLDKFLVKHMTKLEKEVQEAKNRRNKLMEKTETVDEKANLDNIGNTSETIPGLGSILLKHGSKFEKEIEEAKKNSGGHFEMLQKSSQRNKISSDAIPNLESMLVKHSSKLEKEVEEAKTKFVKTSATSDQKSVVGSRKKEHVSELPSLDKFLVKHVSRLEKEVQEAKNRRKTDVHEGVRFPYLKKKVDSFASVAQQKKMAISSSEEGSEGKENLDLNKDFEEHSRMEQNEVGSSLQNPSAEEINSLQNMMAETKETEDGLDKIMVKPVHWLEREKIQALAMGNNYEYHTVKKKKGESSVTQCESLDKVLVKHVSRLEKEKMKQQSEDGATEVKRSNAKLPSHMEEAYGLDQILVKHKSRLEREKVAAAQQPEEQTRFSVTRKEARERELQEQWGGLSLGNSMKPHVSKLQRDKAAWIKAEQEEKRQGTGFSD